MDSSSIGSHDFQQAKQLGSGSFGRVTLVRKVVDQKLYAMKSVLLTRLNRKEKQNALNQVRLLASIRIPYVIGYKGAFFDCQSQTLCIIMEYADGGDLQNKITERIDTHGDEGFEENYIWKVAYQLLNACKKLHDNNIVHRDIKAANVFFANDIAKLGDLNVSKVADNGWCETHTGTPYYTSPEIWNGQRYTSKCDVWSLGCLIYEMCTLHPPFRAADFPSLFRKVIVGEYEQIPNQYSRQLKQLIRMCLTVDDLERPSANALLETSILSGMQLTLESFRHQEQGQIKLIDPIKCPRVMNFLNSHLPKTKLQGTSKKNVAFVTKKQIELEKQKSAKKLRKILSQKVLRLDLNETINKVNKIGPKNVKLPPIECEAKSDIKELKTQAKPLTFTMKKTKSASSKLRLENKENLRI